MLSRDRLQNGRLPSAQTVIGQADAVSKLRRLGRRSGHHKKGRATRAKKKYRGCVRCKSEVGPLKKRALIAGSGHCRASQRPLNEQRPALRKP